MSLLYIDSGYFNDGYVDGERSLLYIDPGYFDANYVVGETVSSDIQSLSPSAVIELFTIDTTVLPGGGILNFHAGTNEMSLPIIWQGISYASLPIEAEGFDIQTRGASPRPKIRVANVGGLFSAEVATMDDYLGCKVTRKRTYSKYLDAVNFVNGNPNADQYQYFPDEVWYVERKTIENRHIIEWELSSVFDLQGVQLPYRQVIQNSCAWKYRSAECEYTGTPFDINDLPTTTANDYCAKRLNSCRVRFGLQSDLPYGGFPGSVRSV